MTLCYFLHPVMVYRNLIFVLHMVIHGTKFNPLKSQTITFGGPNPCQCQIAIEDRPIPWVSKVKYLGVYFCCNNGDTDLTDVCRKFYGHLNSILSVVGRCANEMAAVHLIKTYCLPILTYGCEVWSLSEKSLHTISVVWNNCFRRIFRCCWRDSTRPLQYYCNALLMSYLIDQRRLLFWQKTRCSNNVILRTLSALKNNMFVAIGSR